MKKVFEKLNISTIVGTGYYEVDGNQGTEVDKPHTKETLEIWEKGYSLHSEKENLDDLFEGVLLNNEDILAQWWIDGETKYFKLN